jgi:hypothetical protein
MILVDDKQVEALEARRLAEEQDQLNEPPPTYASLQSSPSGSEIVTKTVNYVSITRVHSSVKETLIIDPSLFVPLFLRPPLASGETEETRKNLRLESTHGHVHADITLIEDTDNSNEISSSKRNKRVVMHMKTTHGGITAKIHGPPNRSSFVLFAQSVNGEIRLHIPRTFHGPLIVSHRHGFVRFSDAISRDLTTFGEADSTRRCFLGDFSQWTDARDGWTGDELVVDVKHGNVKIHYDDDAVGSPVKTRPTLLNRIFGF